MRISSLQLYNTGLNGILDKQSLVAEIQSQIASGKRVDTPADDPVAAAKILSVKAQLSITSQFNENAQTAEERLKLEETSLKSIRNVIQRVRELALRAGDGALQKDDRKAIATEVNERLKETLGFINTQDAEGHYLFSGYQSKTAPFVASGVSGFNYQGDEGQLAIQVGASVQVAVSDSGRTIFADVDAPRNATVTAGGGNTGAAALGKVAITDQADFDGFFDGESVRVSFSVVGPDTTYTVRKVSDNSVVSGNEPAVPLQNIPYVPGQPIKLGGAHLEFTGAPDDGDSFDVARTPLTKQGVLESIQNLAQGLNSSANNGLAGVELQELLADTLISLDNALGNVSLAEVKVGARLNVISDTIDTNRNVELFSKEALSNLEDLDLAEAISNLKFQSTILEAAQGSFVKINNLSLFNFIR